MEDSVYYKEEGLFFRILLNRGEVLNALNYDLLKSILEALNKAESSACRFVVIESLESKAFIAGADIRYFAGLEENALFQYISFGKKVFDKIESLSKLVFSVVDGYCLGGGFELALSADFILATQKSKFGFPEVSLGLVPGFSGFIRIIEKCGLSTAKKLILSGRILDFEEAKTLRLFDYEIESSDFEHFSKFIISQFGTASPYAIQQSKRIFSQVFIEKHLINNLETETFIKCFYSQEGEEGVKAFLEKRKSSFNVQK